MTFGPHSNICINTLGENQMKQTNFDPDFFSQKKFDEFLHKDNLQFTCSKIKFLEHNMLDKFELESGQTKGRVNRFYPNLTR